MKDNPSNITTQGLGQMLLHRIKTDITTERLRHERVCKMYRAPIVHVHNTMPYTHRFNPIPIASVATRILYLDCGLLKCSA